MTVIAVPEAPHIVCPPWCAVGPERHVADLLSDEGQVFHRSAEVDTFSLPAASLELATYVDGTPLPGERPVIYLNEAAAHMSGLAPGDARHLAESIRLAVEQTVR